MRRSALVTGGTGGIGLAVVRALASDGFTVTAAGRRAPEEAAALFADIPNAAYVQADLTSADGRERALAAARAATGRLDALVNGAGIAPAARCDLLDMTQESYDAVMDTNLRAAVFISQLAARCMTEQQPLPGYSRRGVIVTISSISAFAPSVNRGEYCLSKAGLSMLTKLLAVRLAPEGIPVFEIQPGIIETDMTAGVRDKYDRMIADGVFPVARWGTPEDVAAAVSLLCGEGISYATGEVLRIDGGFHIRRL